MYTPNPPTGETKAYIDWILGDGQNLIAKLGFVPLKPIDSVTGISMNELIEKPERKHVGAFIIEGFVRVAGLSTIGFVILIFCFC